MTEIQPHVAIILLNWNGLSDTLECLESVSKNTYPNYSITIIDNASREDELSQIRDSSTREPARNDKRVTFIQNKTNLGFSEGNNVGIREAMKNGAEYIFTLNNDTVVDPDFLTEAIKTAKIEKADIVATTMLNYYDRTKIDSLGHDLLSCGDSIPRRRGDFFIKSGSNNSIMGACAGAALYRVSMLQNIGLFDPDFFLNYEDADLSLRALVQGYRISYSPSSKVYHKISASIGKIKNTSYRVRSQRNQLFAYLHNMPLPVILLNVPIILLRDILAVLVSFLTFQWTITWILLRSRWEVFRWFPTIMKKRRTVLAQQKISSWVLWKRQNSWLVTYYKYFKNSYFFSNSNEAQ